VTPDIVCLSKGITGGFLPLAATVASKALYETFLGPDFSTAFAHGHSYTANPLGCAAALASLALFETEGTLARIAAIHQANLRWLAEAAGLPGITRPRALGSIAALSLGGEGDYNSALGPMLKARSWNWACWCVRWAMWSTSCPRPASRRRSWPAPTRSCSRSCATRPRSTPPR